MTLSDVQEPVEQEVPGLERDVEPLGPDSLLWFYGFPRAALLVAGRSLLLQVMHPVIGAGVRDFSDFKEDPWGRLDRTVDSLQVQIFGGEQARAEAQRLRQMHKEIRGIGFDGEHYSALNQGAYAWVHLSNFDTMLAFDRTFAHLLDERERGQLYAEWRQIGRMLGIRDEHMPQDLRGLATYVEDMIATTLVDNPTARDVIESLSLRQVGPPPWPMFPEWLWRALRPLGRSALHDAVVGTLPPSVRQMLGVPWTAADERRLRAMALALRHAARPVPDKVMHYPMAYRAVRQAKRARARVRGLMTLLGNPLLEFLRAGAPDDPDRDRILNAALDAFMDFGIRRTSMGEIAKRAALSPATLYRRFAGKDEVVWAVGSREASRLIAQVDAGVDVQSDAETQLVDLFMGFVQGLRSNRLLPRLLATEPEVVLPLLTVHGAPVLTLGRMYLADVIRRLQSDGHLPVLDPDPAAEMLARVGLSMALTPETCIPLDDEDAARAFARRHVAVLFGASGGAAA